MKEEEKADLILENNLTYNFEKILNNISNLIDEPLSLNSRKINEKDDYEMERINYELLNNIIYSLLIAVSRARRIISLTDFSLSSADKIACETKLSDTAQMQRAFFPALAAFK